MDRDGGMAFNHKNPYTSSGSVRAHSSTNGPTHPLAISFGTNMYLTSSFYILTLSLDSLNLRLVDGRTSTIVIVSAQ